MAEFSIDFSVLRSSLLKVQQLTGKPIADIVRRQLHILCYLLATKVYPPRKQASGNAAVKRDIRKTIAIDRGAGWKVGKNERLAKRIHLLVRRKNLVALNAIYRNVNTRPQRVFKPFSPALHRSQYTTGGKYGWGVKAAKPLNVTTEAQKQTAYISKMQKRVGRLKSGWLVAWQATNVGGSRPPAQWIKRHLKANPPGRANVRHLRGSNPWASATNTGPGAGKPDLTKEVKKSLNIRKKAMIADVRHQLRRAKESAKL